MGHRRGSSPLAVVAMVATLGLSGCQSSGAGQLPAVRLDYNAAVARSSSEQLLLNLVRLRYLHAPQFFEVASVTTQSSVTTNGNLGLGLNLGLPAENGFNPVAAPSAGVGMSLTETPTVSYRPLQGPDFAERMVRPIDASMLAMLLYVGWRVDRLFACCVARVNDLGAPVISSSSTAYGGDGFRRLMEVLYALQVNAGLEVDIVRRGDRGEVYMTFAPVADDPHGEALAAEAKALLGLDPDRRSFQVLSAELPDLGRPAAESAAAPDALRGTHGEETVDQETDGETPTPGDAAREPAADDADEQRRHTIVLRGRSLLGALVYLSHGVAVPEANAGARSLDYPGPDGDVRVDNPVPDAWLRIGLHDARPVDAYVAAYYQGHWYALAEPDLDSKQVFLLLEVLFSALSGRSEDGPVLTLPVGR